MFLAALLLSGCARAYKGEIDRFQGTLAACAVREGVSGADRVYGIVFIVVLASVVVQGTLAPGPRGRPAIPMREREQLPWELSLVGEEPHGRVRGRCRRRLGRRLVDDREGDLGDDASVTMIVRDKAALQPHMSLQLRPGDRILRLADPDTVHRIGACSRATGLPVAYQRDARFVPPAWAYARLRRRQCVPRWRQPPVAYHDDGTRADSSATDAPCDARGNARRWAHERHRAGPRPPDPRQPRQPDC